MLTYQLDCIRSQLRKPSGKGLGRELLLVAQVLFGRDNDYLRIRYPQLSASYHPVGQQPEARDDSHRITHGITQKGWWQIRG